MKRTRTVLRMAGIKQSRGTVFSCGMVPSIGYGCEVNAMSPGEIRRLRVMGARSMRLRGRSGSLALAWALQPRKDPAKLAAATVGRYAAEWWRRTDADVLHADTLTAKTLVRGFRAAAERLESLPASASWGRQSNGPLADALMWSRHVGWEWASPIKVTTSGGSDLDITAGSPFVLEKLFWRPTRRRT